MYIALLVFFFGFEFAEVLLAHLECDVLHVGLVLGFEPQLCLSLVTHFSVDRGEQQLLAVGFQNLILSVQSEIVLHHALEGTQHQFLLEGPAAGRRREGLLLAGGLSALGRGLVGRAAPILGNVDVHLGLHV